jgi:site-specific DNA-methyltransferase (adenine-specific)
MNRYKTNLLDLRCMDCMELLRDTPNNAFDLAIVDPPYGIGAASKKFHVGTNGRGDARWKGRAYENYKEKEWDSKSPGVHYFTELRRVSVNQIVWGGNYFSEALPASSGWVFWDKDNGDCSFSDGELAWTSFNRALRQFTHLWSGFQKKEPEKRIHPTQKPLALYKWILAKYAKPGQRILDTHMGSGSIAIACHYFGAHLTATEIDEDYFKAACERIENETRQMDLFQENDGGEARR